MFAHGAAFFCVKTLKSLKQFSKVLNQQNMVRLTCQVNSHVIGSFRFERCKNAAGEFTHCQPKWKSKEE